MRTTIWSGRAPGATPAGWDDRWYHSFAFGLSEASGPIEPYEVCPRGWAEIDTVMDPMQVAISVGTLGLYTPSTVTVVCAAQPASPALREPSGERATDAASAEKLLGLGQKIQGRTPSEPND